jgi:hypothetical protein
MVYGIIGGSPLRDLCALRLLRIQVARKGRTGIIKSKQLSGVLGIVSERENIQALSGNGLSSNGTIGHEIST